MPNAIIIDDVDKARQTLKKDLEDYCPDVKVIAEGGSVKEGVELLNHTKTDIVFLDIQMQDGDGFDVLNRVGQRNFKVIFTTASDAHAIRAFKFSAVDYLLKPIDPDELAAAVKKASEGLKGQEDSLKMLAEALKNSGLPGSPKKHERIALHTTEKVHIVPIDEILRCEADGNYTRFHLAGGKTHLVTKTLKEFDELLADNGFFRVHQSHLVNTRCIKEFIKSDGGYLVMNDKSSVPVSTRKRAEVMEMLERL